MKVNDIQTDQKNEVAAFRESIPQTELVKDIGKDSAAFRIFVTLNLEEVALVCLFETSSSSLLQWGYGAKDNSGCCGKSRLDEILWSDKPTNSPTGGGKCF